MSPSRIPTRRLAVWSAVVILIAAAFFARAEIGGSIDAQVRPRAADRVARPLQLAADDVQITRDVEYGKGGDRPLKMDIVRPKALPKDSMPAIVFIHGGGWSKGSKETGLVRILPFAKRGYFCATIDYRLTGEAVFPAQIEDCKCAVRFLRAKAKEYNVDPNRIGMWGTSAGGHLVALLGTSGGVKDLEGKGGWQGQSSRVQAVCDFYGPTDLSNALTDFFGGKAPKKIGGNVNNPIADLLGGALDTHKELAVKASPIAYVSKDDPPFLICHGDRDPTVPLKQSERLQEALTKAGVESKLHVVKGGRHGFRDPEANKLVAEFFDRHLKPAKKDQ